MKTFRCLMDDTPDEIAHLFRQDFFKENSLYFLRYKFRGEYQVNSNYNHGLISDGQVFKIEAKMTNFYNSVRNHFNGQVVQFQLETLGFKIEQGLLTEKYGTFDHLHPYGIRINGAPCNPLIFIWLSEYLKRQGENLTEGLSYYCMGFIGAFNNFEKDELLDLDFYGDSSELKKQRILNFASNNWKTPLATKFSDTGKLALAVGQYCGKQYKAWSHIFKYPNIFKDDIVSQPKSTELSIQEAAYHAHYMFTSRLKIVDNGQQNFNRYFLRLHGKSDGSLTTFSRFYNTIRKGSYNEQRLSKPGMIQKVLLYMNSNENPPLKAIELAEIDLKNALLKNT